MFPTTDIFIAQSVYNGCAMNDVEKELVFSEIGVDAKGVATAGCSLVKLPQSVVASTAPDLNLHLCWSKANVIPPG